MKTILLTLATFLCVAASVVVADDVVVIGGNDGLNPLDTTKRRQVKLAISGGGARGLATIGVLRAFEENQIEVTAIAGTSFGAVVGGLYACGYNAHQLDSILHSIDMPTLLTNRPDRSFMFLTQRKESEKHLISIRFSNFQPEIPKGLTRAQELTAILSSLTSKAVFLADGDFTRLPIQFKTAATDVVSGELVVLDHGSLADAIRATIAYPLAFTEYEIDSRLLMDGGMLAPVPVEIVAAMGNQTYPIVAINTASPLLDRNDLNTPVDIAGQVTTIMTADKMQAQLEKADIIVNPCPDNIRATDFSKIDLLISSGYRHGLQVVEKIRKYHSDRDSAQSAHITEVKVISEDRILGDEISSKLVGMKYGREEIISILKKITVDQHLLEIRAQFISLGEDTTSQEQTKKFGLIIEPISGMKISDISLTFNGNTLFKDSILASQFITQSDILWAGSLRTIKNEITNLYLDAGFDAAHISKLEINSENNSIKIGIDEARLVSIDIKSNQRSRDWMVRSYFPLDKKDLYSGEKASRGVSNIYGTDLFERVSLRLVPRDSMAAIEIDVREKKYSQIRLGWHWHDEYESEQFIELLDDNVKGVGLELLAHAQYGNDQHSFYANARLHRIFLTYITARSRVFHHSLERIMFANNGDESGRNRETRTGFLFGIGQQISRLGTLSSDLIFENVKIKQIETEAISEFSLRSLHFESLVETFDNFQFPDHGKRILFELNLAGKIFSGDVEYVKFYSSLESYFPLGNYFHYHPKISIGISRTGLPSSEKFYIGGHNSLVGYRTDQLTGDKMILINQELRVKLPLNLYLRLKYDFGNTYESTDQIKLKDLRWGYGAAIALKSPIGPIELGYGRGDNNENRVYFNAGLSF